LLYFCFLLHPRPPMFASRNFSSPTENSLCVRVFV
jgi:hypothetical protein